jgi:hypothetical protein
MKHDDKAIIDVRLDFIGGHYFTSTLPVIREQP